MARSGRGCAKVTPNLTSDPEGTRALNLNVLRRLDPAVADILITAAHVVAYNFDARTEKWVPPSLPPSKPLPPSRASFPPPSNISLRVPAEQEARRGVALHRQEVCAVLLCPSFRF
jgi:hypothetical protein